jgi:PKD repeat protein
VARPTTPTLTIAISPTTFATVGQNVTATVTVNNTQNVTVRSVTINWGDGTETPLGAVQSGSSTATHRYAAIGTYVIRATLIDNNGGESSASGTIEIRAVEAVEVDFSYTPPSLFNPRASFSVTAPAGGPNSGIASYTWNFGDGTPPETTTQRTIEHTYLLPGNYDVTLTVNFTDGRAFSRTKRITVP